MKLKRYSFIPAVLFLLMGLFSGQSLRAAVSFTVTPPVTSNTYSGTVTLQVTGLTSGDTVTVQKYLDINTNGVVDANDILSQQFQLTDGKSGLVFSNGATPVIDFTVPGDTDGVVNGQIVAQSYITFDFTQIIVGKYLYVLSSPVGHFAPITNSFSITNFPFGQSVHGTVLSNAAPVSNAIVLVFASTSGGNPLTGAVADNSGAYTISLPVGSYSLIGFKSNFVGAFEGQPSVLLNASANISSNISLTNGTVSISGKVVDANNSSLGIGGLFLPVQLSSKQAVGGGYTDTNGNFKAFVTPNMWGIGGSDAALAIRGYLSAQNKIVANTEGGNVSGLTVPVTKATAAFYGTVKDNLGNPLPGVTAIFSEDDQGAYETDGFTDTNGNYVAIALGGTNGQTWQVSVDFSSLTNYVFSQGQNGITLSAGQAYPYNFTALTASRVISGNIQYNGSPVVGVGVSANATIGGINYQSASAHADASGNYSMLVANGATWNVSLNCNGGDNSLNSLLGGNYECPSSQSVLINNNDGTANFVIPPCAGTQISSSSLPAGQVNIFYDNFLQGATCTGNLNWTLNDPLDFPPNLNFSSNGEISGTPTQTGVYNFSVNLDDENGHATNHSVSLTINPGATPPFITTESLPLGTNGAFYSTTLNAGGGQPPYSWSLAEGSASLPANLALGTNGVISGTPIVSVTNLEFIVELTDASSSSLDQVMTLTILAATSTPRMSLTVATQPGQLQFNFTTVQGVNYTVQYSFDLTNWNPVLSFTGAGGTETISAPTTSGLKAAFYRVKIGP